MRDDDLPGNRQDLEDEFDAALRGGSDDVSPEEMSLIEDVQALINDTRTYAEAELAYQKSRAAFAADRGKSAALYGLFALGFVHLALIALVVGALFALAPLLGPWGATALIVGLLLAGAIVLLVLARGKAREVSSAFKEGKE